MSATNAIKQRLSDLNMSQADLALKIGITRQNLTNKMTRDNFTTKELFKICNALNLTIKLKDKKGKEYTIAYDEK